MQRRWTAIGAVVALSVATVSSGAAPPPPDISIQLKNELSGVYVPMQAKGWLDGNPLFALEADKAKPIPSGAPLYSGGVKPGVHALALHFIYEGRSPVFGYVSHYRFHMRARATIDMRPGRNLEITLRAFDRGDITYSWENRPDFRVTGTPHEALIDVESLPIEKGEVKGAAPSAEREKEQQPEQAATSEKELEKIADATINEVLKEADAETAKRIASQPLEPKRRERVVRREQGGSCPFPFIHFGFAQFSLGPKAERALRSLAACVREDATFRLRVSGHCDARGSPDYNQKLGLWRADSVARFLVGEGIPAERLETISFGKDKPICEDVTAGCFARNRRAELDPVALAARVAPSQ